MTAGEVDLAPIEPERLSAAGAGEQQEHDQRSKMSAGRPDQALGFVGREPPERRRRDSRPLDDRPRAPAPLRRVMHDGGSGRVELPAARCRRGVGVDLAGALLDGFLIDLGEQCIAEVADHRDDEPLGAAGFEIAQGRLGERCGSATTVDGFFEKLDLAPGAEFFGDPSVASASAFFNADPFDGAPDDPER